MTRILGVARISDLYVPARILFGLRRYDRLRTARGWGRGVDVTEQAAWADSLRRLIGEDRDFGQAIIVVAQLGIADLVKIAHEAPQISPV
jgi:hypothetical protein